MSRSYKKTPCVNNRNGRKRLGKQFANRSVRRYLNDEEENELQHGSYKKVYDQFEIEDYFYIETKEDAIREYEQHKRTVESMPDEGIARYSYEVIKKYPTLQKWLNAWYKRAKRK